MQHLKGNRQGFWEDLVEFFEAGGFFDRLRAHCQGGGGQTEGKG